MAINRPKLPLDGNYIINVLHGRQGISHDGSMGLVYLPKWMVDFYGKCSYINIPYSHPMGIVWYCIVVDFPFILDLFNMIFEKVSLPHSPSKKKHMLFFMRFYTDQRWSPTRPQPRKASHQTLFPSFKTNSFPWHQPSYCQKTISRGGGINLLLSP